MTAGRILVVDDELQIRRALDRALGARGHVVDAVATGEEAISSFPAFNPDMAIVDLTLPGLSGLEVCRQIRLKSRIPILILSVRADEFDKVEALDLGADDYLTKPFGMDELMARVRALLRRANGSESEEPHRFTLGDIAIDLKQMSVHRAGTPVRLTKTEWALLECLAEHPGRLLTHQWLLERVWGGGYADDVDVLRVFVSQLRKKIEPNPEKPQIVVTDPGVGYRWVLRPDS